MRAIHSPAYRRSWQTVSVTPACWQASIIRSHSQMFRAITFSTSTCLPALAAATAAGMCRSCGRRMSTPSTLSASSNCL
ncbi:MAG: hypothetical protein NTV86_16325 [Planctomycetota bacterium]|nr:hypothetical protein [Planctomycetota bacterium]